MMTPRMTLVFASEHSMSSITISPTSNEPRGPVHVTVSGNDVNAEVTVPFDVAASEVAKVMMHFLDNGFSYVTVASDAEPKPEPQPEQ